VTSAADADTDDVLRRTAAQHSGDLIVGVQVINTGRAPFHVSQWGLRSYPAGRSWMPLDDQDLDRCPPVEIAPGAAHSFFMPLQRARDLSAVENDRAADKAADNVAVVVVGGGRTFETAPISPALIVFER
jgi:hypothetical protein